MFRCAMLGLLFCAFSATANEPPLADQKSSDGGTRFDLNDPKPATVGDIRRMLAELRKDLSAELAAKYDKRITDLERNLNALADQMNPSKSGPRTAGYQDAQAQPGMSLVHLVNGHANSPMTVLVNGGLMTIEPSKARSIDVPIGVVNVQVLQTDFEPRVRTLTAGQKYIVMMK